MSSCFVSIGNVVWTRVQLAWICSPVNSGFLRVLKTIFQNSFFSLITSNSLSQFFSKVKNFFYLSSSISSWQSVQIVPWSHGFHHCQTSISPPHWLLAPSSLWHTWQTSTSSFFVVISLITQNSLSQFFSKVNTLFQLFFHVVSPFFRSPFAVCDCQHRKIFVLLRWW